MRAALGDTGILMGLLASVFGVVAVSVGLVTRNLRLQRSSLVFAGLIALGSLVAFLAMEWALAIDDFSIVYVQNNHSTATPFPFDLATLWAALEGSILLWALVLGGNIALVAWRYRKRVDDPLVGWAMVTLFVVSGFFFLLMATPLADPFVVRPVAPGFDGPGPNPLLQNHILMVFHPPILYLGYVGFTVPFAFAIGALVTGRVGESWLAETRRWTLFAWGFLTVGIILGAWWSYEVLGWGGYWKWDPVENASFLPWLTGTAYIHSVMVQERRGMLRIWNLSLLCATFALTILGTFLTRSGIIDSVHAFVANTSWDVLGLHLNMGKVLLSFFALIVAVSLGLIAWRGDRLRSPGRMDSPLSREGAFLANNVLFAAFAGVVLLGTVFPLIVEATSGDRVSVGTPYFNRMSGPIGFVLLTLMAAAPVLPWRKASGELLRERLWWPAWAGVGTMVLVVAAGARGIGPVLAFGLGVFAGGVAVRQIVLATRRQGWRGLVGRTNGGMIVHIGVVLVAVAFAASSSYMRQGEFRLAEGESATVAGETVTYRGFRVDTSPSNRDELIASVESDGRIWEPRLNRYDRGGMTVGTPSVNWGFTKDVYLVLTSAPTEAEPRAGIRVIIQPMVTWLWIGGGVMLLGTILAAIPSRRRRNPLDPVSAPVGTRPDGDDGDEPPPGGDEEFAGATR